MKVLQMMITNWPIHTIKYQYVSLTQEDVSQLVNLHYDNRNDGMSHYNREIGSVPPELFLKSFCWRLEIVKIVH